MKRRFLLIPVFVLLVCSWAATLLHLESQVDTASQLSGFQDEAPRDTCSLQVRAPQLIIAGAQKAGTSAIRALLVKSPRIVASRQFEAHFFDSKLFRYLQRTYGAGAKDELRDEWLCNVQRHYQSIFSKEMLDKAASGTDLFFFEKTPSYLLDPTIPQLINQICPWRPKILVMLRNPITRAYSHWKMEREKLRVKQEFGVYIAKEVEWMRQVGLTIAPPFPLDLDNHNVEKVDSKDQFRIPLYPTKNEYSNILQNATYTFLQRGMYSQQLKYWLDYFPDLMVIFFEEFQANPKKVYQRVLRWINVDMDFELTAEDFEKAYQTRGVYRRKGMLHAPLSNQTKTYLEKFFRPYNDELARMLGLESLPW